MAEVLEDIVLKERVFSGLLGGLNTILGLHYEGVQFKIKHGIDNYTSADYNWLVGHASDFAFAAASASILTTLTAGENKYNKYLRAIGVSLVPIIMTYHEFNPGISPTENVFEKQDIACYWAGALAVYVAVKLLSSQEAREKAKYFLHKINPFDLLNRNKGEVIDLPHYSSSPKS